MAKSCGSATITFGLVSIPVKLYTACSAEGVSFKLLTPKGNTVKQQYLDSVTGEVVPQADCHKGYELTKEQIIPITKDELKALEAECESKTVDILEFVPATSVDLLQVEKTYYLGTEGAEKGYLLLAEAMAAKNVIAVAQYNTRGKENLVTIRPYRGGLVLHQMFYANEVRPFEEIKPTSRAAVSDAERNMAVKLVESLAVESFDSSKYEDSYVARVKKAIEEKVAAGEGGTFKTATTAAPAGAKVIDLASLLAASLDAASSKLKEGGKAPAKK